MASAGSTVILTKDSGLPGRWASAPPGFGPRDGAGRNSYARRTFNAIAHFTISRAGDIGAVTCVRDLSRTVSFSKR